MEFEFDPDKSASNRDKHGIDFVEAQALWVYDRYLDIDARSDTEPRFARIGRINGKYWVVFYTLRREVVRIISVRRARENERRSYEEHTRPRTR